MTYLEIPIRPYLKKYIAKTSPTDPFELKIRKCHFSSLIIQSFTPVLEDYKRIPYGRNEKHGFSEVLHVEIPDDLRLKTIPNCAAFRINSCLKSMFENHLCDFTNLMASQGLTRKQSISILMSYYSIDEDDFALEFAQKNDYRVRVKRSKSRRKSKPKHSPSPPSSNQLAMLFSP